MRYIIGFAVGVVAFPHLGGYTDDITNLVYGAFSGVQSLLHK